MDKAIILMATYNGQDYIEQQLDSLLSQTWQNWELFVCDDYSQDSTAGIIQEYQHKDSRIKYLHINSHNMGPHASYYYLLRLAQSVCDDTSYIFFCDQDDIWKNDKIEMEISILSELSTRGPKLCYSDLEIIDKCGKHTGHKISDYCSIELSNPYNIFFKHRYVWGTTVAFNYDLLSVLNIPQCMDNTLSHDNFVAMYATLSGEIKYINDPLVLYRRHDNNVSGFPREHKLSVTFGVKKMAQYYLSIMYNVLLFLNICQVKNLFTEEYTRQMLSGGFAAFDFLKKYDISVVSGIFSKTVFYLIFILKLYKFVPRLKNREYICVEFNK